MPTATESPPDKTNRTDTTNANATNGAAPADQIQHVPLGDFVRSPFNREIETKGAEWEEFVASIKQHGVIQPGVARPLTMEMARKPGAPRLELVIGERRWLGSQAAQQPTMPVIVRQLSDVQALELQAIENDKRKDLNPIQGAQKFEQLITAYKKGGKSKEEAIGELCAKLDKGKSTVYEALRLLKLPATVQAAVKEGKLPPSHAGLIAKLPPESQPLFTRIIAPGKRLTNTEERTIEKEFGSYIDGDRDEETGLISFRDARELVDGELRDIERAQKYESKAADFRKKGGAALTWAEARQGNEKLLTSNDYLSEFGGYVNQITKGVKDLPKQIMRPVQHDPSRPEMVYQKTELIAALKKAGVKPRSGGMGGGSVADYKRRERDRQARARIAEAVFKELVGPIRAAAGKRNAKIPWALLLTEVGGWAASRICKQRGWKADYSDGGKVLAERAAKLPENQMPGLVADVLIEKLSSYGGRYKPEFVALGQFYGVDVKAIAKATQAKLAPPPEKKQAKVRASGSKSEDGGSKAEDSKNKEKKTKGGLTPGLRKKLSAAMKERWAARRKGGK